MITIGLGYVDHHRLVSTLAPEQHYQSPKLEKLDNLIAGRNYFLAKFRTFFYISFPLRVAGAELEVCEFSNTPPPPSTYTHTQLANVAQDSLRSPDPMWLVLITWQTLALVFISLDVLVQIICENKWEVAVVCFYNRLRVSAFFRGVSPEGGDKQPSSLRFDQTTRVHR